jgi:peptidoglycan/xylan/chitin deacetylase (PgdA/CDA1 family)
LTDLLIPCYHAVSERWPASLSIAPQHLEAHVSMLAERGFRSATFHEAVLRPPAPRTVAITFDDAYRSVIELAFPILSRAGFTATVFAPTGFIGTEEPMAWPGIDHWRKTEHADELVPMSWEELRRLAGAGWEIGSHTRSHPRLSRIDDAALEDELRSSREEVARHLGRCVSLAYPYGDHDARVVEAAGRAGYEAAGTLPARLKPAGPLDWPRIVITRDDDPRRFAWKVSPAVRRLRATGAWSLLHAARSRLRS